MIVECVHCKTKFRFDPEMIKGAKTKVRCSRCRNVFEVTKPGEPEFFPSDFPKEKPEVKKKARTPSPKLKKGIVPGKRKERGILRNVFIWIFLLAVLGAGIYGMVRGGPAFLKSFFASDASLEKPSVVIADTVHGYFLENEHLGQIFVVEGEALNESDNPISFILVEGEVFNTDNEVARSQQCYAGNPLPREELVGLTAAEIRKRMMNKEGKDLMNVNIPTKKEVPFSIVYHDLPDLERLSDYSVEVVDFETD
jgi:predicted Zn finger-like uncharacterized protein